MGESTNIPYCHHTFSPWKSCTKVSPGCDNCYAEKLSNRWGVKFGQREPRQVMADSTWKHPHKWDLAAWKAGERRRVLCGSMCDVFDNKAPEGQRERLWRTIEETENLEWLLLSKRAQNIPKYIPDQWCCHNAASAASIVCDEGDFPPNVWVGVSVENRKHGLPRIDILRIIPAAIRWLSIEPLLEDLGEVDFAGIDWVVLGGESGTHARPMDIDWALSIREQCRTQGVPFYMKQLSQADAPREYTHPVYFPKDLNIRQFPA